MDNSIDVFTKLQTMGIIIVPLFAICLIGLLKDELGLDDIGKDLGKLLKSVKRRLNSTKIATKVSKPDESELRVDFVLVLLIQNVGIAQKDKAQNRLPILVCGEVRTRTKHVSRMPKTVFQVLQFNIGHGNSYIGRKYI